MSAALKPLKKAVLPVAGLGTRFLPATKALAKEMLPVVDRPLIQYAIEEARAAGIEQFCLITGRGKTMLVDQFDVAYELERTLAERNKAKELEMLKAQALPPGAIVSTRQQVPLGLGHAIWCARASSTAYWMRGLSTTGSISFGICLVAGRKRVPRPATGSTALRRGFTTGCSSLAVWGAGVPRPA